MRAHWRRRSRNFLPPGTGNVSTCPATGRGGTHAGSDLSIVTEMSSNFFTARFRPSRKPLMIVCTPTPSSMYGRTSFKISAASRVTDVVPSPTSASWARAMSTSVRAAGWTISNSFNRVAPSSENIHQQSVTSTLNRTRNPNLLEMVASPRSFTINLSIPLGPSVVAIVCATARHAEMLERSWGVPWDESVPSRRRTTVGCCARDEGARSASLWEEGEEGDVRRWEDETLLVVSWEEGR